MIALVINQEVYLFTKFFAEVYQLFLIELQVFGFEFRVVDFMLFNAVGHFLLDLLQTTIMRGKNTDVG